MIDISKHISINKEILNGKPHIKGTRIPISTILANLEERMSIEELLDEFENLREENIRAVIKYARMIIMEELHIGTSP